MSSVVTNRLYYWISSMLIYLSFLIANLLILRSEYQRRKESSIAFTTKWLKSFSLLCIISGFINPLFSLLGYIPFLCTFTELVNYLTTALETLFMGYYQLSRLYYCFANDQTHSNKGYPKYLFSIMYALGLFFCINVIPTLLFNDTQVLIISDCGYDHNYNFYYRPL